jgi:competence protein ComEC
MMAGGLWFCIWKTRWRLFGLAPALVGAAWALSTPVPDLLVTGDGQHLALRTDGGMALLRPRAGDYVRDLLNETSGLAPEALDLDMLPTADCSPDICLADVTRGGRTWRVLATRSTRFVPVDELARACADADIAVSDRRLPRSCNPRWLKADRSLLARTGGLAISFGKQPRVATVAEERGRHPWALAAGGGGR